MNFTVSSIDCGQQALDCLVVGVFTETDAVLGTQSVTDLVSNIVGQALKSGDFIANLGNTLFLQNPTEELPKRILLVGCGKASDLDENKFQTVLQSVFKALQQTQYQSIGMYLTELMIPNRDLSWLVRSCIAAAFKVSYRFDEFKSEKNNSPWSLEHICFQARSAQDIALCETAIQEGLAINHAVQTTKNLANTPCNICTPSYLAEQAQALAKSHSKLKVKIIDEKQLEKMGFGAFCSVSRGSEEPGKLIILEYQGGEKHAAPYALVGKGITFDTGGLSLKPALNMVEMKFDMTGAATVFGAMQAISELNLPINVVAAMACAENMPDGRASKPDSVVKTLSGLTVEITNTDAEGRLVLCDTLTYMEQTFKPKTMIDLATLTGAIIISLGRVRAGYFSNNDALAADLELAANQAQDLIWRMPLDEAYQSSLDSPCADMVNANLDREAGSVTAARFLSRFVKNTPWVHLDIAGVANITGKNKAATGRSVALMIQYLLNQAAKEQANESS